jgi:hypothetical protein
MFLACSGGGSSSGGPAPSPPPPGATTSLQVADKVSVVDAKLSGSVAGVAPLKVGFFTARATSFSATSDYNTDKTNVYVQERSAEQFDTINNILCMMGQSKYDAMLNKGDYLALVDQNVCDSTKSNASSAGQSSQASQSSGANMPSYMKFTVNSSRVDNNSPEIVKVWIHQEKSDHNEPALIYAYITIDEGKSDTNPYGIFSMNFAGFPIADDGTVATIPGFKGTLQAVRSVASDPTSKVLLQFVQSDSHNDGNCGLVNSSTAVTLDRAPDGSGGAGHVKQNYSGTGVNCTGSTEFDLAFNSADFFRKDLVAIGNPSVCLDRVNFKESSWSYGLYDVNGARVQRDSGFPIAYTAGGKTYNGWIGYWGLWIDNSAPPITNGTVVSKVDYNNGSSTSTPYTVFASGGKLKKHTRKSMTLGDIKDLPLGYNEFSQGTNTNYQVVWDGSNFNKVAQMPQNCNGNCTWAKMASQPIDITSLPWGNLNFWSQNGSGQYQVQLASCSTPTCGMNGCTTSCSYPASTDPSVIFYAEDLVYPGDTTVPVTFSCYDNCPTVVSGQATMPNMMSGPSNTATTYSFDPAALMLKDQGGAPVISTMTNSIQQWGVMTGALFEPSPANMALLKCPWDQLQTCTWQAMSVLPFYYTWETGPNNYNQFIAIKDQTTGAIKKFDPPLQVKYVDANGTTFLLDYSGFGQLNGIPGKCVDMDSGADADCSQGGNGNNSIRWVPQFTIPGLTPVTATDPASNAATDCYVKPLQVEQRMMPDTTVGACLSLAATDFTAYTLPDTSLWSDPKAAEGAEPVVTSAPAVIGGVVQ